MGPVGSDHRKLAVDAACGQHHVTLAFPSPREACQTPFAARIYA
jgi:hypothetical protein